jgi:ubiquitin C-terminal hydrolase
MEPAIDVPAAPPGSPPPPSCEAASLYTEQELLLEDWTTSDSEYVRYLVLGSHVFHITFHHQHDSVFTADVHLAECLEPANFRLYFRFAHESVRPAASEFSASPRNLAVRVIRPIPFATVCTFADANGTLRVTASVSLLPTQPEVPYVGLLNQGATCYMNSILQSLFHVPEFRALIYAMDAQAGDRSDDQNICLNLQRLFGFMQLGRKPCSTLDLMRSFGWKEEHQRIPQDVQEFLRVLLENLENKMRDTNLEGRIPALFRGRSRSFIRARHVNAANYREDVFYDLSLVVNDSESLEESFQKYIQVEPLQGANQWDSGEFGKQDADMGVEFLEFPAILHIHLRRFQFDYQTLQTRISRFVEFAASVRRCNRRYSGGDQRGERPGPVATLRRIHVH